MGSKDQGEAGQLNSAKLDQILTKLEKLDVLEMKIDDVSTSLKDDVKKIESKLDAQGARVIQLERQVRKRNLILMGMSERSQGVEDDLSGVVDLIQNGMRISCSPDDIEDLYRLGKPTVGKNRPICFELKTLALKRQILAARALLSGSNMTIKEDLPPEERERRRLFWEAKRTTQNLNPLGQRKRPPSSPIDKQPGKKNSQPPKN
ncbi:hypothetical protein GE061_001294 [Apolygus lucorum]|uniref:Uncharacterized protein n=1 Tax=Apolygus lucorum TaxID=248454 RepID=A0A8S9Y6Y0_APOLU|nr:hypothetical protein GE061_001294 [Apolygus lucorum]